MNGALIKALSSPDVSDKLATQGVEIIGSTPEAFGEWIAREGTRWGVIIRRLKVTVD